MSLARSFHSDPHGMIFIHAPCDQPLMNSPITKLSFVIPSEVDVSKAAFNKDTSLCSDVLFKACPKNDKQRLGQHQYYCLKKTAKNLQKAHTFHYLCTVKKKQTTHKTSRTPRKVLAFEQPPAKFSVFTFNRTPCA